MSLPTTCLLLIDGHAAAYRFFHGIRPMTTPDGVPVQAVFGFIRMMQGFIQQFLPTHVAVAFDGGVPQSRLELVPDYKAQRKPMPDALRVQLPIMQEYLEAAKIPVFRFDAVEADDILATLALRDAYDRVLIGTSDKDMFQLIGERISIVSLSGNAVILGSEQIHEKTGVYPHQIADWLALTGDAADNIPGVPGVGAKTAAALLANYDDLDGIYKNLELVKSERIRAALRDHAGIVRRNRAMVLLDQAIPCLPDMAALARQAESVPVLRAFYEKYAFKAFLQKLREPELF